MVLPSTPLDDLVSETFNGNYGFIYDVCVNFSLEFESLVSRRLLLFFERSHRSLFLDSISSLFSHSPHVLSYFLSRVSQFLKVTPLLLHWSRRYENKHVERVESARWREGKLTHSAYSGICSLWSFPWKGGRSQQKKWKTDVEIPVDHVDDDLSVSFSVDADRSWLRNNIPSPKDFSLSVWKSTRRAYRLTRLDLESGGLKSRTVQKSRFANRVKRPLTKLKRCWADQGDPCLTRGSWITQLLYDETIPSIQLSSS